MKQNYRLMAYLLEAGYKPSTFRLQLEFPTWLISVRFSLKKKFNFFYTVVNRKVFLNMEYVYNTIYCGIRMGMV